MEINKFKELLKKCKSSFTETTEGLKVRGINPTNIILYKRIERICRTCGSDLNKDYTEINVLFYKEQKNLTIFEANLLYLMFAEKKIIRTYSSYHECIAGKEFIGNIKEIKGGVL